MPYGDAIMDNALPAAAYAVIGAALFGSVVGVFIEKWLVALLTPVPVIVVPMGALLFLRPFLERGSLLTGDTRDLLLELADPSTVLQMTIAAAGGALLGCALIAATRGGGATSRPSAARKPVSAKTRLAAVADRTPLQSRTERLVAAPRPAAPAAAAAPAPIYEVAAALPGSITASSVADADRSSVERVNRRQRGRRRTILSGFLLIDDNRSTPCRIVDLSDTGARVRLPTVMPLPPKLWLINASEWRAHEVALAWRSESDAGLTFLSRRDLREPATAQDKALHALCAHLTAR